MKMILFKCPAVPFGSLRAWGAAILVMGVLVFNAQAATYLLGTSNLVVGPIASSSSVILAVHPYTTAWTATANSPWLHLSADNQSGTGCTNVIFSFDSNPDVTRFGTLTIAGQTLTVTQAGSNYVATASPMTLVSGIISASGVAVDKAGNAYISLANQEQIQKWTASNNTVTTVVSSGLSYPYSVVSDGASNIYIGNQDDGTIKKKNGTSANTIASGVSYPAAFGVDNSGNLYFANGTIQKWTAANGVVSTFASNGISNPDGVIVDKLADNAYFISSGALQKWTAENNAVTELASSDYNFQDGLALDGSGNVYMVAQDAYIDHFAIMKWTAADNSLNPLILSGQAEYFGLTVDGAGNIYFTDAYDGLLQEIPNAFVDPTSKLEGLEAGSDSLQPVVPASVNLLAPFVPTSDSAWLTITGITNGVVSYSFPKNLTPTRTGHINLLGQSISVTQIGPSFSLGVSNLYEGVGAGSDSVVLSVVPNIGIWTVTTNLPWLHLNSSNLNGTGSTNVVFSFDANTGVSRSALLTISGQRLTVTQAGSNYVASDMVATLASVQLNQPNGVAVDAVGNVYIADTFNNAIKKWSPNNNTVTTLVASGLNQPRSVAVDGPGNIYIADTENNSIEMWTASNSNLVALVSTGLNHPQGVAVDIMGNVYIADTFNNMIKEWSVASNTVTALVSTGLNSPAGVAVDRTGNVYITDTRNNAVKEWVAANNSLNTLAVSGQGYLSSLAVDGAGNVYFADSDNSVIRKWTAASSNVTTLNVPGLITPTGLAVDGRGDVYIADAANNFVEELPHAFVNPTGKSENQKAGNDVLPAVVPVTANLLAPFTPVSDQPWLTITGVANGTVIYSYTTNISSSRVSHITLLGKTIPITQAGITPPILMSAKILGNGSFQFSFTNTQSASFRVLSSTNVASPLGGWTVVGSPTNISPSQFQFTAPLITNGAQHFYRVLTP